MYFKLLIFLLFNISTVYSTQLSQHLNNINSVASRKLSILESLTSANQSNQDIQDKASCNTATLNQCYMSYFKSYGFSYQPSYNDYVNKQGQMEQNPSNLDVMCGYFNTLSKCIKNQNCISLSAFSSVFINNNYKSFYADYKTWDYACGSGKQEGKAAFNCKVPQSDVSKCRNIGHPLTSCDDYSKMYSCYAKLAKKQCNKEAADYTCTAGKYVMEYVVGCSNPKCNSGNLLNFNILSMISSIIIYKFLF